MTALPSDFPASDDIGPGIEPASPGHASAALYRRPGAGRADEAAKALASIEATPPAERGQRLATLPRGEGVELRVSLDTFKSNPFVSIRQWRRDVRRPDLWWPDARVGCSVRMREIDSVIAALQAVRAG